MLLQPLVSNGSNSGGFFLFVPVSMFRGFKDLLKSFRRDLPLKLRAKEVNGLIDRPPGKSVSLTDDLEDGGDRGNLNAVRVIGVVGLVFKLKLDGSGIEKVFQGRE